MYYEEAYTSAPVLPTSSAQVAILILGRSLPRSTMPMPSQRLVALVYSDRFSPVVALGSLVGGRCACALAVVDGHAVALHTLARDPQATPLRLSTLGPGGRASTAPGPGALAVLSVRYALAFRTRFSSMLEQGLMGS